MSILAWLRRPTQAAARRMPYVKSPLRLESLGERINPSAATHFAVLTPPAALAGRTIPVQVVALDASNHVDASYTGTVHFSSSDTAAVVPADFTFTTADRGRHNFAETTATAGVATVSVSSTDSAALTGSATFSVNPAPVATHFAVIAQSQAISGSTIRLTVAALDANNHLVENYTGTVHFSNSDTAALVPSDYTFVASDHGLHTFSEIAATVGAETITATAGTVSGSATVNVTAAPVATHFGVAARVASDGTLTIRVTALDAQNHPVSNYTGTINLTASTGVSGLPSRYTFTADDHGSHSFTGSVVTGTTGTETITATSTDSVALTGSITLTLPYVPPAHPPHGQPPVCPPPTSGTGTGAGTTTGTGPGTTGSATPPPCTPPSSTSGSTTSTATTTSNKKATASSK